MLKDKTTEELRTYLRNHAEDISKDINDFGDLKGAYYDLVTQHDDPDRLVRKWQRMIDAHVYGKPIF